SRALSITAVVNASCIARILSGLPSRFATTSRVTPRQEVTGLIASSRARVPRSTKQAPQQPRHSQRICALVRKRRSSGGIGSSVLSLVARRERREGEGVRRARDLVRDIDT